jgi:two-component system, NarL family, invasion response regulator UvrY
MRLLILDDHPIMRLGVRQLLEARWPKAEIIEAELLAKALELVRSQAWNAVISDLSLPDANGLESLIRLRRAAPEVPILVLSMHAEEAYARRALQNGASGYLTKEQASAELVLAVERILAGGRYISASIAGRLADLYIGGRAERPAHESLSTQEYRVLIQLAEGASVGAIAETMHLSVKTVSTYRSRILEKLGLKSNADLTRYCLMHELMKL